MKGGLIDMTLKERQAQKLAEFVHLGQVRRGGEPYINHPKRVALGLKVRSDVRANEDMICAAWLHDAIEMCDCRLDIHQVITNYFSPTTMHLVAVLTHETHETYDQYIQKVAKYPAALIIKFVDMIDNTTDIVIGTRQFEKYRNACLLLQKNGVEVPMILKERLQIT